MVLHTIIVGTWEGDDAVESGKGTRPEVVLILKALHPG